jgi:hypothetical protein
VGAGRGGRRHEGARPAGTLRHPELSLHSHRHIGKAAKMEEHQPRHGGDTPLRTGGCTVLKMHNSDCERDWSCGCGSAGKPAARLIGYRRPNVVCD